MTQLPILGNMRNTFLFGLKSYLMLNSQLNILSLESTDSKLILI